MTDLPTLVEDTPVQTRHAELDFRTTPTELHILGVTYQMGVCCEERPNLARGLAQFVFQTGPYRVTVTRDDRVQNGPLLMINVEE
jgi:hypothetical protein